MANPVLGIDISKSTFHVALLRAGKVKNKTCQNSAEGFSELFRWLEKQDAGKVQACMEATGRYWEKVAEALASAGHQVSVVNPARIEAFARSELLWIQTDSVDAALIARFCLAQQPDEWHPAPREVAELKGLVRRLADLQEMLQMERNRLQAGEHPEAVNNSMRHLIETFEAEIKQTKKLIRDHINRHPGLKGQSDLLTSIPGIGEQTAAVIIAEVQEFSRFESARKLACYAGLTPREKSSGTSIRGKASLSKVGNAYLRKALFFPAIVAKKYCLKAFADRLTAKGKCKMVVVAATMRKLLHLVFGVLKSNRPYDPAMVGA
jgi:transposase